MKIETYTGGLAETNGYLIQHDTGWLAIDAPEGMAEFCSGKTITGLVLTHGHWDHIWDGAEIARSHRCPVYGHADDADLFANPNMMSAYGLPEALEEIEPVRFLKEGETLDVAPWAFSILHIPGHCPGSILLYEKSAGVVFGGDVLFAGAVGRWDLPRGNQKLLLDGIKKKLLVLPDNTILYPGHGPDTTLGQEKRTNPFCQ
ncbi:MAG: MBL fold metallo-hydrolase [Candidatus Methylacidiphilales bacterium]|nr:MBL fold metallo-hydrolase [Candidatus Methylacidiphilales bacterium]